MKKVLLLLSVSLGLVTGGTLFSPPHTAEASVTPRRSAALAITSNVVMDIHIPWRICEMVSAELIGILLLAMS